VERFMGAMHDWAIFLGGQMGTVSKKVDWERVGRGDALYISSMLDVARWWREHGKYLYPRIAMSAAVALSKKDSNAYQERVFSKCTFVHRQVLDECAAVDQQQMVGLSGCQYFIEA
jgi:hypothetical protein